MKSFWSVCAVLLLASWISACSVYMAATRPTPIDTGDYPAGMTRDEVITKLGPPYNTMTEADGATCDYYKLYTRGYGAGGKIPNRGHRGRRRRIHRRLGRDHFDPDGRRDQERKASGRVLLRQSKTGAGNL